MDNTIQTKLPESFQTKLLVKRSNPDQQSQQNNIISNSKKEFKAPINKNKLQSFKDKLSQFKQSQKKNQDTQISSHNIFTLTEQPVTKKQQNQQKLQEKVNQKVENQQNMIPTQKKTTLVNIRKESLYEQGYNSLQEWLQNEDNIYISDKQMYVKGTFKSKWCNPFKLTPKTTNEKIVEQYKKYLIENENLKNQLHELKGKTLGCWCLPKRCHGHALLELINEMENE